MNEYKYLRDGVGGNIYKRTMFGQRENLCSSVCVCVIGL